VGIDKLNTHLISGAMSGEQLFRMEAALSLPSGLDPALLQQALEGLANELMVDLSLDAAASAPG
jgi:glycine cleavage system regulatory protein